MTEPSSYWGDPDYSRMTMSAAAPLEAPKPYQKPSTYAVIYTWPPDTDCAGKVEVRYRRSRSDPRMAREVLGLQRKARHTGHVSPYSISTKPEHIL